MEAIGIANCLTIKKIVSLKKQKPALRKMSDRSFVNRYNTDGFIHFSSPFASHYHTK